MRGNLLKDLILLRKAWIRPLYLIVLCVACLGAILFLKDESVLIIIFISMLLINSLQSLFVNDYKSSWQAFMKTTNTRAFSLVMARYISALVICTCAGILCFLSAIGIMAETRIYSKEQMALIVLVVFVGSILYVSLLLPFLYMSPQIGTSIAVVSVTGLLLLVGKSPLGGKGLIWAQQSSRLSIIVVFCLGTAITYFVSILVSTLILRYKMGGLHEN